MEENTGAAASAAPNSAATKKKREEKSRKKDPRSWENVSKTFGSLDDAGKLTAIEEKYNELYNDYRKSAANFQSLEKQYTAVQKEKDHKQSELTKSIFARARLENLCRELQKQNKQIKEENLAIVKEEEDRRKELSLKFDDKLTCINNMMADNKEKSEKLRLENQKMTAKLAELYKEFQKREEDVAKMSHQMELERQYSQATLAKIKLEVKAEKEIYAKEHSLMQNNLEKSEANCRVLLDTVRELEKHIDIYKSQYQDFESSMSKSNKVFDTFKFEMSAMSKQVTDLEKEAQSWRTKWQESTATVLELTEMRRNQDIAMQAAERKLEQLQKLCRQLQVDRAAFLRLLKSNGIEPVSQICVEEKPAECPKKSPASSGSSSSSGNTKMSIKEHELQLLKTNLKAMQDELNRLKVIETKAGQTEENSSHEVAICNPDENGIEGAACSSLVLENSQTTEKWNSDQKKKLAEALVQVLSDNLQKIPTEDSPDVAQMPNEHTNGHECATPTPDDAPSNLDQIAVDNSQHDQVLDQ